VPHEHVENADTRQASISLTNEPPPLDPLENGIGQDRKLPIANIGFRKAPKAAIGTTAMRSVPALAERRDGLEREGAPRPPTIGDDFPIRR
jgi:hypothetical protein